MLRQIIVPNQNSITLQIPLEYIGKQIEIIAFPLPLQSEKKAEQSWKSLKGKYKGKLSSVEAFIQNKEIEKLRTPNSN